MNAQLPITTTARYNFPHQKKSLELPHPLIELSLHSLRNRESFNPIPKTLVTQGTPTGRKGQFLHESKMITLKPNTVKTPVVAIDVSSIKLGETERGILLATRGAIVWGQSGRYKYVRLGPFPFHITGETLSEIWKLLHKVNLTSYACNTLPKALHLQTRLTSLLERWMQKSANQTTYNSLILWDGSITAGTPETPIRTMKELLQETSDSRNTVLAFSKMTRLLSNGLSATDLAKRYASPCLLKLNHTERRHPMHLLGNTYIAKLTRGNCAFRLDTDERLSDAESAEAVQKLLGNDLVVQSYPETLRLAHIFSTFTANEVLAVQRWIIKKGNLKIITRPDIRRLLFGRFGKGPDG